jgi:hypothetical protein
MDATQGNEEMTNLSPLIERVRGLTGPDREVDAVVFEFFGGLSWVVPPAYTASLDAVVSLIERELPGWALCMETKDGIALEAYLIGPNYQADTGRGGSLPFGGKPTAICVLLAALTAIKERDA